jgi:hypothetical protein
MDKLVEKFMALSIGEKIIIVAALVLFIDGFLPWYSVSQSGELFGESFSVSFSANGWEAPGAIWSILAIFLGLAMATAVVLRKLTDVDIPEDVGGMSWPRILLGGGAASLVLVLIKLLNESSNLGIGFYLGIILAAALAAGGFLMFREETAGGLAGPPAGQPPGPPPGPPPSAPSGPE